MHIFKAFTVAVIVIWCHVKGSHSKSKNKSIDHEHSSHKKTSLFTELVETSSTSSFTTKSKKPIDNHTFPDGAQSPPSTVLTKMSSETKRNKSDDKTQSDKDKSDGKVESEEKNTKIANEEMNPNTKITSKLNATESAPVFRSRMKHHNKFKTIRYGNSTVRRKRLHRKGFGPHWRTMDNGTRVRVRGKLRMGRGENGTFRLRAQRLKKRRKQGTTSTNKPSRVTGLSDNEHKKNLKHHTSSTEKVTRDESVFSDTESKKDIASSETENVKERKHHTKITRSDKREADEPVNKKQGKHHASSIKKELKSGSSLGVGHIKDDSFTDPERKKDISLSDTEHMDLLNNDTSSTQKASHDKYVSSDDEHKKDIYLSENEHKDLTKHHTPSTKKASHDKYVSSDSEGKKDISLSENEHKELSKHHTSSTKKALRDRSSSYDTASKKEDHFSYIQNRARVKKHQEMRTHPWPKRKGKKTERQDKKYWREQTPGHRETSEKWKPNHYKHDTETTTQKSKKTTKADLGEILKPYTIKAHLNELKCKFSNVNITIEVIGRTMSYYDIVMMRASAKRQSYDNDIYFRAHENKFADDGPEKRIIFIVHGLSVMGIHDLPCLVEVEEFEKLLSYYFAHIDKFDIFLIPMANPDGVAVPRTNFRSYTKYQGLDWNKNTSPQSECPGVALDRNFDVAWASRRNLSSCNQQYPGPYPFSEHETQAIRDVLHRYSQRIVAYLDVHAGTYTTNIFKGDAVLYPKGYTEVQSDDDRYIDLRGEIEEALKNASFQVYTVNVDTLYNWYGKVGGTSVDYAASVYGIPYSMELVMQLYDNTRINEEEQEQHAVLRTSWRRVIDVVFNSVQRYLNATGN